MLWLVAIGSTASAYFILAANSWMQHPVGYRLNPVTHRAEMTSIFKILTNSTLIRAFGHTIAAAGAHRRDARARRRRLAPAAPGRGRAVRAGRAHRAVGDARRRRRDRSPRPRPGPADDEAAADEDGRRRGALQDGEPARASRSSTSARGRSTRARASSASPSRTGSRSSPTTRGTGRCEGINDVQAAVRAEVRARQLRADRRRHVLDVPDHGRPRLPRHPLRRRRAVARARTRPARAQRPLPPARASPGSACRSSRTSPAGSSPRWAASPGSCRGCCSRRTPSRPPSAPWSVGLTLAGFTLLYGVLAAVEAKLMIGAAKAGPDRAGTYAPRRGRACAVASRPSPTDAHARRIHARLLEPADALVLPHRRALDRLLRPRGVRLRRRHAPARSSAATSASAGRSSARSARSGTATRCGCSSPAARPSRRSPAGTRRSSPASTSRSSSSSSASSSAGSRSSTATSGRRRSGAAAGTRSSPSRAPCPRSSGASRSRTSSHGVPIDAQGRLHRQPARPPPPVRAVRRAHDRSRSSPSTARSSSGCARPACSSVARTTPPCGSRCRRPLLVFGFLVWTWANAASAHDKGLVPGIVPIAAMFLPFAAAAFVRAGRPGFAFAATAVVDRAAHAHALPQPLPARARVEHEQRVQPDDLHDELVATTRSPSMSIVALVLTPIVLLYQTWSYWVFRARLGDGDAADVRSPLELLGRTPLGQAATLSSVRPVDPRLLREAPAARRFLRRDRRPRPARRRLHRRPGGRARPDRRGALPPPAGAARAVRADLVALVAATVVRAAIAWALESGGRITALAVAAQLRAKLLAHLLTARPGGVPEMPAGELAAAAVGGLDALDPYFARFLPQLVLSAVVPVVDLRVGRAGTTSPSAVVMALTLPLIPIFGVLIGKATEARTLRRFATLSHLSAYFLDVVRGLPTLRAFGRGKAQSATIAAVSDAYRIETMGTLRIAFLSALVLELAATMSTAVIAAEIGIRLVDGGIALAPALAILVLAPEYYGPLRNAAAQFHASADGLAAAARVFALLDLPPAVRTPDGPGPGARPARGADPARARDAALPRPRRPGPSRDLGGRRARASGSRSQARAAPARRACSRSCSACSSRAPAGSSPAASTSRASTRTRGAAASRGCRSGRGSRPEPSAPRSATAPTTELVARARARRRGCRRRRAPGRARHRARRAHAALGGRDPPARARARARDRPAAAAARRADDAPRRDERRGS